MNHQTINCHDVIDYYIYSHQKPDSVYLQKKKELGSCYNLGKNKKKKKIKLLAIIRTQKFD
jgi:hypothetical protein